MVLLDLNSPPNLQYLCHISICSSLLKQRKVKKILSSCFTEASVEFQTVEWPKAQGKLIFWLDANLYLSSSVKNKLLNVFKLLTSEIRWWLKRHIDICSDFNIDNICFTPYGVVDKIKTARLFIREGKLTADKCFDLACLYCLEAEIRSFWKRISKYKRLMYISNHTNYTLSSIWVCLLERNFSLLYPVFNETAVNDISSLYKFAFKLALNNANDIAVRYFGKMLNVNKIEYCFVKATAAAAMLKAKSYWELINSREYTKVFMCLFSGLNDENKLKIMETRSFGVLKSFLDDPWKDFFLEVSKYASPFLSDVEYVSILHEILKYGIIERCTDYDLQIFRFFWKKSPQCFKQPIIESNSNCFGNVVIKDLLAIEDRESIALILKDLSLEERVNIACNNSYWEPLIHNAQWDLLRYFLSNCLTSSCAYNNCRKKILNEISICKSEEKIDKQYLWENFLKLIDQMDQPSDETTTPPN